MYSVPEGFLYRGETKRAVRSFLELFDNLSWTEKFKLDVWYVDHVSLKTDLEAIAITFKKLIKPEGINQEGQATMEAFNGHN